jgi:plastocyanin
MGVIKAVPIGLTTDHAILSPDGAEVWFTSNADHNISVLDTATSEMKTVIKDPADGDIHGGVFVQYKDNGKGGVVGEVVADYSGLHGSALAAQQKYVAEPTLTIAMNNSGFLQKSLTAPAGTSVRLTIKNVGGTGTGRVTFQSKDMGIEPVTLEPGQAKEIRWAVPAQEGSVQAQTSKSPNNALTLDIKKPAPKPAPAPAAQAGPREIPINAKDFAFDVKAVTVKAGETVRFVLTSADDEKHNIVAFGESNHLLSPDVGPGQKVVYEWTAPSTPGTFKVVCNYHPTMAFDLKVE